VREGDAHSWVEVYIDDPVRPSWRTFDPTPSGGAQPLEPPGGAYYYMRDFVEALSQRWDTYVVGYDLRKQVHIFEELSHRYEHMRSRAGVNRGPLDALTRGPVVAGGALVLGGLAYALWRRRRRLASAQTESTKREVNPNLDAAAALYRALESALQVQGITRAISVPPLRHAEDLKSRSHPLADEVLSLTNVYLEARFGGAALTDASRRSFERRVRGLRTVRMDRPDAAR
jgi:hypothetical protein